MREQGLKEQWQEQGQEQGDWEDSPTLNDRKRTQFLSAMFLVALGAGLGGAGVVLCLPPPPKLESARTPAPEYELVEHENVMRFRVNPQTEQGNRITASVGFRFVYKRDKHKAKKALKAITDYWNQAYSRCLMVISNQDERFLASADGKQALRRMLVSELTLSFFPQKTAAVEDILWTEYLLQ